MLYEKPNTQASSHTDTDNHGTASSSTDPPPKRAKTSHRRGSESLSLSQAVEAYYASDIDSENELGADAEDSEQGDPQDPSTEDPDNTSLSLLISGLYQGYAKNGYYYAMGSSGGQHYVDLVYDPAEDSSWFDEMIKPLESTEVPTYFPMQGSNWGAVR